MAGIASILPGIAGGVLGEIFGGASNGRAQEIDEAQLKRWLDLNVPDPADQAVVLQQYKQTGRLDPEMEQAIAQDPSAMESVSTDPRLRESQMASLGGLEDLASSGGMTLMDKANLEKSLSRGNEAYAGATGRISQNMQERGMGGSGMEMVQKMQAAQTMGQNAANAGLQSAADASSRGLDALISAGKLGGDIEDRDFGQKSKVASAKDSINQFNTANQRDVGQRNTAAANNAAKYNLDTQQRIADANVDTANTQEVKNKSLIQQRYDNEKSRLSGAAGASDTLAGDFEEQAKRRRSQAAGVGEQAGRLF